MLRENFNSLVENRLKKIKATLTLKQKEYADDKEVLRNFINAARFDEGETPAQALWGMAKKHLVSVQDMIQGRVYPTPERVDAKLGDMINYLILLEAIWAEAHGTIEFEEE